MDTKSTTDLIWVANVSIRIWQCYRRWDKSVMGGPVRLHVDYPTMWMCICQSLQFWPVVCNERALNRMSDPKEAITVPSWQKPNGDCNIEKREILCWQLYFSLNTSIFRRRWFPVYHRDCIVTDIFIALYDRIIDFIYFLCIVKKHFTPGSSLYSINHREKKFFLGIT